MPTTVAHELEKMHRSFLWGRKEGNRKIHYVKWEKVKRPKRFGGLEIQGMVDKNMILLAKWWWRLVSLEDGLWRRMVIEKYKLHDLFDIKSLQPRQSKMTKTWKDIFRIIKDEKEVGSAFRKGLSLKLGRGDSIKFWIDAWAGEQPLKFQFPKLFNIAVKQRATISEMGWWIDSGWKWAIRFRRNLYQWEELAKEV
ncbi:hypothetical protein QQ045_023596 [Rhodiola kirilowii]